MARIDALFKMMKEQGASDLHLSTGNPPIFRLHGEIVRLNFKPMTQDELQAILYEILTEKQKAHFEEKKDLDFAYAVEGLARFRGPYPLSTPGTRVLRGLRDRHCPR
jgi:twitching motility protein PilT